MNIIKRNYNLVPGDGRVDDIKDGTDLTDNSLASDGLSHDCKDESRHSGAPVDLLGEEGESLRDLLLLAHHDDGAGATDRYDCDRSAGGKGSLGHWGGGAGKNWSGGDEGHCAC